MHPEAGGVGGTRPLSEQYTELRPDVLVAAHDEFTPKHLPGAPLLAVEVLSPSTRRIDLNLEKAASERMGAAHFWLIDPATVHLWAYELGPDGAYRLVGSDEGNEVFTATHPFPVSIRPSELLRRRSPGDDDVAH